MADVVFLPIPKFVKDFTGHRFGRLVVMGLVRMETRSCGDRIKRVPVFLAQCDCGNTKEAFSRNMRNGLTSSCGCLQKEARKSNGVRSRRHGMTNTREHRTWLGIIERCCNPNGGNYKRYGARGIGMCDRWRNSFEAFFDDMGPRPSNKHSIDRIDNDKGYSPENCRWATNITQSVNRSTTVFVDYKGESVSLSEAARRCGVSRSTMRDRYMSGLRGADLFQKPRHAL